MDMVRQSLAVTFVFALLWAALWFLRRRGPVKFRVPGGRGKQNALEACGKIALGPQHSIHLVRIGKRVMVLAVHPSGVTLLRDAARVSDQTDAGGKIGRGAARRAHGQDMNRMARAAGACGEACG